MFFRAIAFLVGLIAVIAGYNNYNSSISTAAVPLVTGGLVMIIAIFNLLPQIRRCSTCNKKIARKAVICRHCNAKQSPISR